MKSKGEIKRALEPYRTKIETTLKETLRELGANSELFEGAQYALLSGGKRFRPALVLMVAEGVGKGKNADYAAAAIEYFHTASLIVDDLPCMDDDDVRRDIPSLHAKYGETIALLISYALIAGGYELIAKNARLLGASGEVATLALECAAKNTGFQGATGGQFLDIYPPSITEEMVREVFQKKTGSLFEISFVFGWIFGGGDLRLLPKVREASSHFGMAFQIADDLGDVKQDSMNGRKVNFVTLLGTGSAIEMFHVEQARFLGAIRELGLSKTPLALLGKYLEEKVMSF